MDKADVVAPFVGSFKPVAEGGCPDARPPPTPLAVLSEPTHQAEAVTEEASEVGSTLLLETVSDLIWPPGAFPYNHP